MNYAYFALLILQVVIWLPMRLKWQQTYRVNMSNPSDKELKNQQPTEQSTTNTIIRPKKDFLIIGCVGLVASVILEIILWFTTFGTLKLSQKIIFTAITFWCSLSQSGLLILTYCNFRIELYDDHFIYQNFWHVKKNINYQDIKIQTTLGYTDYPEIYLKKLNGKFSFFSILLHSGLENQPAFMRYYKKWKNKTRAERKTNMTPANNL